MNLSWHPVNDDSVAVAVAREKRCPSHYRLVYLSPHHAENEDERSDAFADEDNAHAYVSSGSGNLSQMSSFGAAKLSLPNDGCWVFEPLPPAPSMDRSVKSKRDIYVISGPSGSGKSYWIKSYTQNYHKLYPANDMYLISSLAEDDTLDAIKELQRIDTDKLLANPPKDVKTWTNSLMIIDDVEGLEPAKGNAVQRVQDMVASEGRHTSTTLLRASHLSTDYKKTRLLLQEAHGFVIFPQAGAHSQYMYLLCKYGGMDKKVAMTLLHTPSRWILVHHAAPRYILTPTTIYLTP